MATFMPSVLLLLLLLYKKQCFKENDTVGNLVDETRKLNRRKTLKWVLTTFAKNVL